MLPFYGLYIGVKKALTVTGVILEVGVHPTISIRFFLLTLDLCAAKKTKLSDHGEMPKIRRVARDSGEKAGEV